MRSVLKIIASRLTCALDFIAENAEGEGFFLDYGYFSRESNTAMAHDTTLKNFQTSQKIFVEPQEAFANLNIRLLYNFTIYGRNQMSGKDNIRSVITGAAAASPQTQTAKLTDEIVAMSFLPRGVSGIHPAILYLSEQRRIRDRGWLRIAEAIANGRYEEGMVSTHLAAEERLKLFYLHAILASAPLSKQLLIKYSPVEDLSYAWGIDRSTLRRLKGQAMAGRSSAKQHRKPRTDKGKTILNCPLKRKQVFSPLYAYKRMTREALLPGQARPTDKELAVRYSALSSEEKKPYEEMATQEQERAVNLPSEVGRLRREHGSEISNREMATKLAAVGIPVSKDILRRLDGLLKQPQGQEEVSPAHAASRAAV